MMAIEKRNEMNKVMEISTSPEAVLPSLHVHMHKPVLTSNLNAIFCFVLFKTKIQRCPIISQTISCTFVKLKYVK